MGYKGGKCSVQRAGVLCKTDNVFFMYMRA